MDTSRERDRSVERLLRQSLQTPRHDDVTDACLDAETVAAWVDGGLSGTRLEMARSHVADCARCQALVGAMTRTNALVPPLLRQPEPERAARPWLAWLVPVTAAAAAVALWVAVPRDLSAPPPAPRGANVQQQASETKTPQEAFGDKPKATLAVKEEASQAPSPELRKEAGQLETDSLKRQDAAAAPAAVAPSAPLAETARAAIPAEASAGKTASANVADQNGPRRTVDGICGAGWGPVPAGITTELTAGAAPSTSVCWVVGRGGVVLLSIDGRTWRRVAFPEMTDLSAVQTTDARTASVTTADGRMFTTSDGGVTWDRR